MQVTGKKRTRLLIISNTLVALEMLRSRPFRSFLTIAGVFIGVFIIIAVAAVLNGFRQSVVDSFEQFGTTNIYISRFPMMQMGRPDPKFRKRAHIRLDDAQILKEECSAIAAISPILEARDANVNAKYENEEVMAPGVRGVFPSIQQVMEFDLDEGRFFTEEECRRGLPVCIIGHTVANTLFPVSSPIGKSISLLGQKFLVLGVMTKVKGEPFGGESEQDSVIFMPYYLVKQKYPWRDDIIIMAKARTGRLSEAINQIEEVLRRRRHVPWNAENDFEINTSQSMVAAFDKIVFATLAVMFSLSTVAFMVGGVGVMNIMLASVKERTREIGVRRAIGARRLDIVWQFLTEAIVMTGMGGLLGVGVGEAIARTINALLPVLPCAVPMWARIFGLLGSASVGLVFGLWPAIQAAKLDPIKALRYE